jgi:hypothetical protein
MTGMSLALRQAIPGRPARGVQSLAGVVTSDGMFYVSKDVFRTHA